MRRDDHDVDALPDQLPLCQLHALNQTVLRYRLERREFGVAGCRMVRQVERFFAHAVVRARAARRQRCLIDSAASLRMQARRQRSSRRSVRFSRRRSCRRPSQLQRRAPVRREVEGCVQSRQHPPASARSPIPNPSHPLVLSPRACSPRFAADADAPSRHSLATRCLNVAASTDIVPAPGPMAGRCVHRSRP